MGFDGLFFGRADYEDKSTRNSTKTKEMVWKASANLGELSINDSRLEAVLTKKNKLRMYMYIYLDRQGWLFTGILPNRYGAPGGVSIDSIRVSETFVDIFYPLLISSFFRLYIYKDFKTAQTSVCFRKVF